MARHVLAVIVGTLIAAGCNGAGDGSSSTEPSRARLEDALIAGDDLPGDWSRYEPQQESSGGPGPCGTKLPSVAEPTVQAATAWAQDPVDGPIFGERIEAYSDGRASERLELRKDLPLPCEWEESGVRWRATVEPPIDLGDDSGLYLIESLTGRKGYNYEVALRRGDVLVLFVLNTREPDRELLEELVRRGWEKADEELDQS